MCCFTNCWTDRPSWLLNTNQPRGSGLWRLAIQSPEALSLNLGITRFDLAEGAKLVGASLFSLKSTAAFTHPTRNLDYRSDRSSVTNFHAFGYLHRRISIMQRTANESAVVADAMEQKVK